MSDGASDEQKATSLSLLKVGPAVVTLCGTFTLVISVSYDWAYFHVLGVTFLEVPTSLADHARSALLWLPISALGFALVSVLELLVRRIEGGRTEAEIVASIGPTSRLAAFRRSPSWVLGALAVLFLSLYALLGDRFLGGLSVAAMILWGFFLAWVYGHPLIRSRSPRYSHMALLCGGILLISTASSGALTGRKALQDEHPRNTLKLRSGVGVDAAILRILDRGVLIKPDKTETVVFVPWAEVDSMTTAVERRHPFRGLRCEWFRRCPP